ncbi:hypothetical protein [Coleofasciculus chthonoplastes]|uniref:hypothetical protein n=1 Tax=Coleofasciculus chthonoplastes TaxID=64178 RepID=UPI0033022816
MLLVVETYVKWGRWRDKGAEGAEGAGEAGEDVGAGFTYKILTQTNHLSKPAPTTYYSYLTNDQ